MKTAEELRVLLADSEMNQMQIACEEAARRGAKSAEYLSWKTIPTKDIDWAISEMVALGFKIDKLEDECENSELNKYKISWD